MWREHTMEKKNLNTKRDRHKKPSKLASVHGYSSPGRCPEWIVSLLLLDTSLSYHFVTRTQILLQHELPKQWTLDKGTCFIERIPRRIGTLWRFWWWKKRSANTEKIRPHSRNLILSVAPNHFYMYWLGSWVDICCHIPELLWFTFDLCSRSLVSIFHTSYLLLSNRCAFGNTLIFLGTPFPLYWCPLSTHPTWLQSPLFPGSWNVSDELCGPHCYY